jgi:hypothetical protein
MTPVALRAAMRSPRGVQVRRPASHRSTYVTSCPFPRQLLFSRHPCSQLFDSVVVWGGGIVQTEMLSMCSCHSACRWHCHVVSLKTLPQVSPTVANAALVFSARDRRKARPKKEKKTTSHFVPDQSTLCSNVPPCVPAHGIASPRARSHVVPCAASMQEQSPKPKMIEHLHCSDAGTEIRPLANNPGPASPVCRDRNESAGRRGGTCTPS